MKHYETHFNEYIKSSIDIPLHSVKILENMNNNFTELNNFIVYGPPGVGKYTQTLMLLKRFSQSELKYEKKIVITYNKTLYYIKISDIHYEVDMSLLGCNGKLLWHEIYNKIVDIISSKNNKIGVIICKNFHEIHSELLDNFYSYMQILYQSGIIIKFILITEHISFLPDNILNYCRHINITRPSRNKYNKCFKSNYTKTNDISLITNIKDIKDMKIVKNQFNMYEILCDKIIDKIIDMNNIKYINLREIIYDLCIYNLNINNCVWYILEKLIIKDKLDNNKLNKILIETYNFFKFYNNNYRPIYHLERYILYITATIHELL